MSSNFRLIVDTIDTCSKTGIDIAFATNVGAPGQVLQVYQSRVLEIKNYLRKDQILVDQLFPVVHTVYSLSGTLRQSVWYMTSSQLRLRHLKLASCVARNHSWLQGQS